MDRVYKYVKIVDSFDLYDDTMDIAYLPIEGRNFENECKTKFKNVFQSFPYHESSLDEPSLSDVIYELQDDGWDILESDCEGYDPLQKEFAEMLYLK